MVPGPPTLRNKRILFEADVAEGLFELVNAQKSGRLEILRGSAKDVDAGGIEIDFSSVMIVNDSRMIKSGRKFRFRENVIDYELQMSTTENPSYERHLRARLKRPGL